MYYRRLGRTGHHSSIAILGGAACWAATVEEATQWLDLARARGVNHLDIAPRYGAAESVVGPRLSAVRSHLFISEKTLQATPAGVEADFDQTRRLLGCDLLDLYQAHSVNTLEELDRRSAAIEHLLRLRDQGRIRFAGITGHDLTVPRVQLEALRRFDLDTVMFPVYPRLWALPDYRETAEELLALCRERDIGVMAIKSLARRQWADGHPLTDALAGHPATAARWATSYYEPVGTDGEIARGVRFALSTPGVSGFCTPSDRALLPQVLDAADHYTDMTPEERLLAIQELAREELIFPIPR